MGLFPCVTVKGRVTSYLWVSRNSPFLWCLSNGSSHFYHFPQIRKTILTPPLHSLLSELWSLVFILKTTSTSTPSAYNPPSFVSYAYIVVSSLSPTSHFPSEPWMGRSVSGLASLNFSHALAPEPLGCETNLPTMGLLPLSVQFNRCWHVGGYPWVKIRFPCFLLTPHWSRSLCVRLGVKSSPVWSCACAACFAAPLHWPIECCFEMLTLYKPKRKCKK